MAILPEEVTITNQDTRQKEAASIALLTTDLVDSGMGDIWWMDKRLVIPQNFVIVDEDWPWREVAEIQQEAPDFPGRLVAVISANGSVEGAMGISTKPIKSSLVRGKKCLYVTALATAPHNREELTSGNPLYRGVGYNLIRWAVTLSMSLKCEGRLKLSASPDEIDWYKKRGFEDLNLEKEDLGGILYLPMELGATAAIRLSSEKRGSRGKKSN